MRNMEYLQKFNPDSRLCLSSPDNRLKNSSIEHPFDKGES